MGTLEQFTRSILKKAIREDYPHLRLPAVAYAVITAAKELDDIYTVDHLTVMYTDTQSSFRAAITAHWHEYTLRVVDRFGNANSAYPVLPGVRSRLALQAGTIVAVAFAGGSDPAIIGAVVL